MSLEIKYRPEIDGLRAVAVLSVMLFHGAVPGFSGGFVGVDVFFVISGFLITGILLKELQRGHFSLAAFYERRARRIMPALFLVLLFSVVVGWFVLDPSAFRSLGSALIATVLFGSNILFWRVTSYFADAFENPLLHTWSLGVEEQFYLFFPLILLGLWKSLPRHLGPALVMLAVISLCVSTWALGTGRQAAAFYLLPSRAFELLLGSLAAWVAFTEKLPMARPWAAQGFSIVGLISIQSKYVTERFDGLSRPLDPLSEGRKIVVIGDSFAQDFTNMYHEAGAWGEDQVRTVYIPAVCQITLLPGDDAEQYIIPAERSRCAHESTVKKVLPLIDKLT